MTRALVVASLLLLCACGARIVRVETSAPNAVAYLVKGEPATSDVPSRFIEKVGLPSTMKVRGGNHWLYVDAPHHAPRVIRLDRLRGGGEENKVRVELQATGQQEYLQ